MGGSCQCEEYSVQNILLMNQILDTQWAICTKQVIKYSRQDTLRLSRWWPLVPLTLHP